MTPELVASIVDRRAGGVFVTLLGDADASFLGPPFEAQLAAGTDTGRRNVRVHPRRDGCHRGLHLAQRCDPEAPIRPARVMPLGEARAEGQTSP
jgi:hypothetical protein